MYNFKKIQIVPDAKDLVDTVLTRTTRKTPTVIHANFAISRIRSFYIRKIKFTQQTIHDKLTQILDDFPRMDGVHPFYSDLMNVLYDKDHYKVALGQINTARHIIDNLAKDYTRLVKFGDSLFKCKQLKRAALGRMCTLLRQQQKTTQYLEEVRKHLSRLPSIDPNTRSLIVTGFPNVGKSSFVNQITRADVEVQPYAFTTKSIHVGHTNYAYLRWQVLDTPGILDHPLEARNTIEMQAVTALAHLHCAVLFFIDISEECGFTIDQQISLFENIKPLFHNKPLMIVATKIDVMPWEKLSKVDKDKIENMVSESGAMFEMLSNYTEEGINEVKTKACDRLLKQRVSAKLKGKKVAGVMNRITVTEPTARDSKARPPTIPASVLAKRKAAKAAAEAAAAAGSGSGAGAGAGAGVFTTEGIEVDPITTPIPGYLAGVDGAGTIIGTGPGGKVLAKDLERGGGGPGVFRFDVTSHYDLRDPSWKTDVIPEIMDGKNILDCIDPDILRRLEDLEREEEANEAADAARAGLVDPDASSDEDEETMDLVGKIRTKKALVVRHARTNADRNRSVMPRTTVPVSAAKMAARLESVGIEAAAAVATVKKASAKRGRSLTRDEDVEGEDDAMGEGIGAGAPGVRRTKSKSKSRAPRDRSRQRSASRGEPVAGEGLKDAFMKDRAFRLMAKKQRVFTQHGRQGESDRVIGTKMPKHLYQGKRKGSKTADHR